MQPMYFGSQAGTGKNAMGAVNNLSRSSSNSSRNSSSSSADSNVVDSSNNGPADTDQSVDINPNDLLEIDKVELMSENDSQGSDQKPVTWIQNLYDIWKFVGVVNY